jgi:hypothetical protein
MGQFMSFEGKGENVVVKVTVDGNAAAKESSASLTVAYP